MEDLKPIHIHTGTAIITWLNRIALKRDSGELGGGERSQRATLEIADRQQDLKQNKNSQNETNEYVYYL